MSFEILIGGLVDKIFAGLFGKINKGSLKKDINETFSKSEHVHITEKKNND